MVIEEAAFSLEELVAEDTEKIQGADDIQEEQICQNQGLPLDGMVEVGQVKKRKKRQWGPALRVDRPRRVPEDGRTIMQRAQDLKEKRNTVKGMRKKLLLLLKAMKSYYKKLRV
jgi:hypothetical protein